MNVVSSLRLIRLVIISPSTKCAQALFTLLVVKVRASPLSCNVPTLFLFEYVYIQSMDLSRADAEDKSKLVSLVLLFLQIYHPRQ